MSQLYTHNWENIYTISGRLIKTGNLNYQEKGSGKSGAALPIFHLWSIFIRAVENETATALNWVYLIRIALIWAIKLGKGQEEIEVTHVIVLTGRLKS